MEEVPMSKAKHFLLAGTAPGVGGCSPLHEIGGAYFPAWLICMIAGFLATIVVRVVLMRLKIDPWIRPRPLAYPCLGIAITLFLHLVFFSS